MPVRGLTLATMVEPTAYKDRIALALSLSGETKLSLQKHLEISYQAMEKVLDGRTRSFKATNNAEAARFMKVDAHWLATGQGEPNHGRSPDNAGMPFSDLNVFETQLVTFFRQLSPTVQHEILVTLNDMVPKAAASPADPYAKGGKRARGISVLGELTGAHEKGASKK